MLWIFSNPKPSISSRHFRFIFAQKKYEFCATQLRFNFNIHAFREFYQQQNSAITNKIFQNTNEIGSKIADGLINLFKLGVDPRAIHIVGFSLGAQIAGVIGRYVISKSKEKYTIGRITGLDPGQIMDAFVGAIEVLSDRDAEFVDVLHTESVAFGSPITTGTVSFWVNGGVLQPNCESPIELRKLKIYYVQ